ncbi:MAG: radical SAM protein [Deltaproteobacteria bacterium]|nr:radical SAM protein [Deltaproteobacteria bacterium]
MRFCDDRPLLVPCSLDGIDCQLDTYAGCAHGCSYCYARDEPGWSDEVRMHRDLAARLEAELGLLAPGRIYLGWSSDPYQPAEAEQRQTRAALEILVERGFAPCVLTKSDLVTRDIDLFRAAPGASAGLSLAFDDERIRMQLEADSPPLARRIEALAALRSAGVETYAMICPLMPGLCDVEALIDALAPQVGSIWFYRLEMQPGADRSWRELSAALERYHPELLDAYRALAFSGEHPAWGELRGRIAALSGSYGPRFEIRF